MSASGAGSNAQVPGSADVYMAGWQMAPYDLSSVAYSDSPSGSGSSYSEIVPYSPLGAGFERKEKQYVISSRFQRAASRALSSPPLSPDGLVSWSSLRIPHLRRKVAVRSATKVRSVPRTPPRPRLLCGAMAGARTSPKKGGGVGDEEEGVANLQAVNAGRLCMLPKPLIELLQMHPISTADSVSSSTGAQEGREGRGNTTSVMSLCDITDAHELAQALVCVADRLEACQMQVQTSVYKQHLAAHSPNISAWLVDALTWQSVATAAGGAHNVDSGAVEAGDGVVQGGGEGDGRRRGGGKRGDVLFKHDNSATGEVARGVERGLLHLCKQLQSKLSKRVDASVFLSPGRQWLLCCSVLQHAAV